MAGAQIFREMLSSEFSNKLGSVYRLNFVNVSIVGRYICYLSPFVSNIWGKGKSRWQEQQVFGRVPVGKVLV